MSGKGKNVQTTTKTQTNETLDKNCSTTVSSENMALRKLQQAALVTREAYQALLELKQLVDSATKKIHTAELETVGQVVGSSQREDALKTLRTAAESLTSPNLEAAVAQARLKIETAVALHLAPEEL